MKRRWPLFGGDKLRLLLIKGGLIFVALSSIFVVLLCIGMPALVLSDPTNSGSGLYIFDRYNKLVCRLDGNENRLPVPLSKVSKLMQQAVLAAEDHRFYSHHGVDLVGSGRALVTDLRAGQPLEGASTITQQLVKNLFFKSQPRTLWQKGRELIAAAWIEMRYSKETILQAYLNEIYFGNGAYGIERAAELYFAKEPDKLNLGESAFLAGVIRAPSILGSSEHRPQGVARQHEVLNQMVDEKFVSAKLAEVASVRALRFKEGQCSLIYPYYVSYVLQILKDKYGSGEFSDFINRGLRVYTNLDPVAEAEAEQAIALEVRRAPTGISQSALVSIAVSDGAVIALAGGVGDYWTHQFNRATNPHTAGSAFKPFVYLTALCNNVIGPDSTVDDSPLTVPQQGGAGYSPKDFDGKFLGPISVRKALALSRNICAVRLAAMVGIPRVIDTAHRAGIDSQLDENLSLALGSSAVSPLELAGAYSTLARSGVAIEPKLIRRINDAKGAPIAVFESKSVTQFDQEPVAELVDIMQDVVRNGTGKAAQLDRPVAGKTGTADQSKDVWFVGFTPDIVTAVWSGSDDNRAIRGSRVTGGSVAARCWHDYMTAYYQSHPTPVSAFLLPTRPLAPESDFSEEPAYAAQDQAESSTSGEGNRPPVHSRDADDEEKPGAVRRFFHKLMRWF